MPTFTIRAAQENEAAIVLEFIKKLAEYEKLAHELEARSRLQKGAATAFGQSGIGT